MPEGAGGACGGVLALWKECRPRETPSGTDCCLTLRGTPLLSWETPICGACESLLASGWGRDAAECPELEQCRETLNSGFERLEDAVPTLAPLLGLLEPGLYVLSEGDAYPADGGGRFFWDVPDTRTPSAATAPAQLFDDDYDCEYSPIRPVFLYPSQKRSRFDPDRAAFYRERFERAEPPPRGIALHATEGMSLLLDGHRKAAAALRCAASADLRSSLKTEAFQVLAAMRGGPDAENFFVDFFVGLDSPPDVHGSALDKLTKIAHSFWN